MIFVLLTDNKSKFNCVYGNVNINIEACSQRTVSEWQTDKEIQQTVHKVSRIVHTYREPAKVQGLLYLKHPPTVLHCLYFSMKYILAGS